MASSYKNKPSTNIRNGKNKFRTNNYAVVQKYVLKTI